MKLNCSQWQTWKRTRHNWQIGTFSNLSETAIQHLIWSLYITCAEVTLKHTVFFRVIDRNEPTQRYGVGAFIPKSHFSNCFFTLWLFALFWWLPECKVLKNITPGLNFIQQFHLCTVKFLSAVIANEHSHMKSVLMKSKWESAAVCITQFHILKNSPLHLEKEYL